MDAEKLSKENEELKELLGFAVKELVATCNSCKDMADKRTCSMDCKWKRLEEAAKYIDVEV